MKDPQEEEYHTSNHFPGEEGEEDPSEGTPVGDDPRVVSKEMRALEDEEPEEDEDDNPDATRTGPPISLQVVEGPDAGKKRRFKSVRMVVGRGKDVDLRLSDQAVSRRHLELIHGDTGTLLRDLGGATGTKVNDERVEEKLLKHGDEIVIGRTLLRFVDELEAVKQLQAEQDAKEAEAKKKKEEEAKKKEEEAAARKAAAANATAANKEDVDPDDPRFKEGTQVRSIDTIRPVPTRRPQNKLGDNKVIVIGGAGVGLVVLVVVLIIVLGKKEPPAPPPPDPKVALAATKMQAARSAIREGEYMQAVGLIEEAEKLKPGIDEEGLAKAARAEATVIEAFQAVRAAMKEGNYEEARQKLDAAPTGTTAKSDEERTKLDKELTEAEGAFYTKKADELLAAQDLDGVRAIISKLPSNAQPLYRTKIEEVEAAIAQDAANQAKQDRNSRAAAAKRAAEKRAQFIVEAFDAVERKFENGDYDRAVLECDRVVEANKGDEEIRNRAKNLKRLIPQFGRTFEDAMRKVQSNSLEAAVRPLKKSEELYMQIGFSGGLLDTIHEKLAEASVRAGKAAMARNDVASASKNFREALRLNPDDQRARDGLASLESKVEELYQRAYVEKDRDPRSAAEKFRIVIDTAPEGSELRDKAQIHLRELNP
ncbi:FHA domain-containing protein [Hyalangium versicolor]|uniref:FHA domain-containing protein n=1 Tax=Hyalangium versicolor TaxID=2861190 RepID=UPI001CCE32B5|nr:FHA domain-containing protein [Hyalangium versicolor]